MTWDSGLSLVLGIAGLVLAVVAIWLSFKFYEMSEKSAQRTEQASKDIHSAVDRLEKVFEMQYSDTFSMVRDTYTDFRRRLLSVDDPVADKRAESVAHERAQQLKLEVTREIDQLVTSAAKSTPNVLKSEVDKLAGTIVEKSMAVDREARHEAAKQEVALYFAGTWAPGAKWRVGAVATHFRDRIPLSLLLRVFQDLRAEGVLQFEDPAVTELTPETLFHISNAPHNSFVSRK